MMVVGALDGVTTAGLFALTNAGAANTGSAMFIAGTGDGRVFARRLAALDVNVARSSVAQPFVLLATLTTAGASAYFCSRTPTTSAVASATFSQATAVLGAVDSSNTFAMLNCSMAAMTLWNRALTTAEISFALRSAGAYYGVPIS